MKTTTKTTQPTIEELRARYPYIPAYSAYMQSFAYWTDDQLRQAHALDANTDCYRVDKDEVFTIGMIENESLVTFLKDHRSQQQTVDYINLHLGRITKGEYKRKVKFTHEQSETNWLSLDETSVPVIIKWLKKQYLSKK